MKNKGSLLPKNIGKDLIKVRKGLTKVKRDLVIQLALTNLWKYLQAKQKERLKSAF